MRKRNVTDKYKYGYILEKESRIFFKDLYNRIGLKSVLKDKKVLDLGCGFGIGSVILSEYAKSVIGGDIRKYEEWDQIKNKKVKFKKVNSSKLPFKDNTFDCVYIKDLLHHIKEIDKTLEEVKRVTKNEGVIVVLEGNRYNPVFYIYTTKLMGHDHFTQNEFEKLINKKFSSKFFIYLEAYPPFRFPMNFYKIILRIEKEVNKLTFLKPLFTYNVAIINNKK